MNFIILLTFSTLTSANYFNVFKRATCDTGACVSAARALSETCDVNSRDIYKCLCNDMSDSFYENIIECAQNCDDVENGEQLPDASGLRSIYCELASQTGIPTADFGGFGGGDFGDFSDFVTPTFDFDSVLSTIQGGSAESEETGSGSTAKTTGSSSGSGSKTTGSGSGTAKSGTNASETKNLKTMSEESASAEAHETSETTTSATGAAALNSVLSNVILMLAILI